MQFFPITDTECLPNQVEITDRISPSGKAALFQRSRHDVTGTYSDYWKTRTRNDI